MKCFKTKKKIKSFSVYAGIDYVLTQVNDVITPVVLEVKVQGCLRLSCMYEALNPEVKGQAAREMLQTMTGRAHVAQLRGKMVLVVGAAGYSKRHLWKEAAAVGVKVGLIWWDINKNCSRATCCFFFKGPFLLCNNKSSNAPNNSVRSCALEIRDLKQNLIVYLI